MLAGAAAIAVSWDETAASTATASFTVFDRTVQFTQLEFFFAGVATGAVFLLGLALLFAGLRRSAARRKQLRATRMEARDRVAQLEEEKRELERKLEATPTTPAPAPAVDRDRDGVDDRDEPTGPHPRIDVPRQSNDQLVAGRHQRTVDSR
ncbi:hypothetical protein Psi01_79020 [Planobispora siamensis]|uniref:Lipopolysaccharide assembly protein A domain-containing protein n=1 Tax=Planobispora siamensis TaxID=936338 RepID=A0A8J3SQY4_9ACTN|nr:hypothetical protein Psi01_79020 [Planobispora siamensis]